MVLKNKNNATKALRHKVTPGLFKLGRSLCEPLSLRALVAGNQHQKSVSILKLTACFILIFTVFTGCEELIDNKSENIAPILMVVDAMITNQPGESYVKLSLPLANPNDELKMISGAIITITDGKNHTLLAEDLNRNGIYLPDAGQRGVTGKEYKIIIRAGEFADSAVSYLLPVSPLNKFKTSPDKAKNNFYFLSGENSGEPSIIKYIIDPPGCQGEVGCRVLIFSYILSSFDVPQIFSPKKESLSFPSGSRVIRKKYSLNPEYEAYTRAVLSETEWRGGLFDVQPGNQKGNFGDNTLGFFAGCSLVIDTVYIQ